FFTWRAQPRRNCKRKWTCSRRFVKPEEFPCSEILFTSRFAFWKSLCRRPPNQTKILPVQKFSKIIWQRHEIIYQCRVFFAPSFHFYRLRDNGKLQIAKCCRKIQAGRLSNSRLYRAAKNSAPDRNYRNDFHQRRKIYDARRQCGKGDGKNFEESARSWRGCGEIGCN